MMLRIFSRSERSGLRSLISGLVLASGSSNQRMVCSSTVTSMLTKGSKSVLVDWSAFCAMIVFDVSSMSIGTMIRMFRFMRKNPTRINGA